MPLQRVSCDPVLPFVTLVKIFAIGRLVVNAQLGELALLKLDRLVILPESSAPKSLVTRIDAECLQSRT